MTLLPSNTIEERRAKINALVDEAASAFVTVTFVKKDGSIRKMMVSTTPQEEIVSRPASGKRLAGEWHQSDQPKEHAMLTNADPRLAIIKNVIISVEGIKAMVLATSKGHPALAGVDRLLCAANGSDYKSDSVVRQEAGFQSRPRDEGHGIRGSRSCRYATGQRCSRGHVVQVSDRLREPIGLVPLDYKGRPIGKP